MLQNSFDIRDEMGKKQSKLALKSERFIFYFRFEVEIKMLYRAFIFKKEILVLHRKQNINLLNKQIS